MMLQPLCTELCIYIEWCIAILKYCIINTMCFFSVKKKWAVIEFSFIFQFFPVNM